MNDDPTESSASSVTTPMSSSFLKRSRTKISFVESKWVAEACLDPADVRKDLATRQEVANSAYDIRRSAQGRIRAGERRSMRWPTRGRPELHQRGKFWIVRWYSPIEKRARAYRTTSERAAHTFYELTKDPSLPDPA